MGEQIVFAFAAAAAIVCAVLVITLKGPFRATVALIGTLLSLAVLFVLLMAPFVAAIQVIVYAGAIVVLFLFVIAYLGERPLAEVGDRLGRYAVFAWIAVIALARPGRGRARHHPAAGLPRRPASRSATSAAPRAIGRSFIDRYIVPFEATSLALLVAAVGAVLLAKRAVRLGGRPMIGETVEGVPLVLYIGLSGALFLIGLLGVMTRRNPLLLLLSVELLLNSANLALVALQPLLGRHRRAGLRPRRDGRRGHRGRDRPRPRRGRVPPAHRAGRRPDVEPEGLAEPL